jgi:Uma2 family endonuclease
MAGIVRQQAPILSVAAFRDWLTSRPDEEHWELIEGIPVMMTPPTAAHQRIATNLENLLNDALERYDPELEAYQGVGLNVVSSKPYDPEPDVVVVRRLENLGQRYFDQFYLVAEILSESDKRTIDDKRNIYREHPSCACILLVRQDLAELTVDSRNDDGWRSQLLRGGDELRLPAFGLICPVKAIYRRTPLG